MNISTFLIICLLSASDSPTVHVKEKKYEGYIFDSSVQVDRSMQDQKDRFTPSISDIAEAEKIINSKIKAANEMRMNQSGGCPVIHKKLKKYKRQYVGFVNLQGEHIVWVNFIWHTNRHENLSDGILYVNDGGSFFWQVMVNLSTRELFDLVINGSA